MKSNKQFISIVILTILVLIIAIIASIILGAYQIDFNNFVTNSLTNEEKTIIFELRLPRIIGAICIGASLSVSGLAMKSVLNNPLADTGLLGIQSGASVVAIIVLLILPEYSQLLPIATFTGGMLSFMLLMMITGRKQITPIKLVLSGVVLTSLFSAIINLISIFKSQEIGNVLTWLNGSLDMISMNEAYIILVYSVILITILFMHMKYFKILSLDDYGIRNLGYSPEKIRTRISIISVALACIGVAFTGVIGFMGLIIPHLAKYIVGTRKEHLFIYSAIFGSLILLLADLLQRIIFAPTEVPVGIVIAFIGAPIFFVLVRRQNG